MQFTALLALAPLASAHFILNYPPSLGFDDSIEGESPCGGFPISFADNDTTIPVGGFPINVRSIHPEADWLFRGTLDQQAPFNWTNFLPVTQQIGLGVYCIPDLVAPASWAGKSGLIQVSQDAIDGELFQCAAVKFVSGTNSSVGSSCSNVTGLQASIITGSTSFPAPTASGTGTPGASAMSMSSSALAPMITAGAQIVLGGFGALIGAAALL